MIQPLGDRVIVKPDPAVEETTGGILLANALPQERGEIIAVADGLKVKPGDRVVYGKHAGSAIEVEGDNYLILRESEIFAIL